ncbi:hypothetical protein Ddye_020635 [Dipteronia dyeriana]|uniref:RNase H type-1 domain-containing protein n=1 Tax=Dipteronia dyeriana TaxID=168575 RepID=A0AAD9U037_9ROSI|nr:hypothetical protein Ddye_020635 [Dipteronia dyeriana]
MIKFRIVWWYKHYKKGSTEPVSSLLNVKDLCVDLRNKKIRQIRDWIPQAEDYLKFNVDGSSKGNPGSVGIGGVLGDSKGAVICMFSQFVGIFDSNTAKIMAIKRVMKLCFSISSLENQYIVIVNDSKSTVAWINKGDFGNVKYVKIIHDIKSLMQSMKVEVVHDSRAYDAFADNLEKHGSIMAGDFYIGMTGNIA